MIEIDARTCSDEEIYSIVVGQTGKDTIELTGSNQDAILKMLKLVLEIYNDD
jgi:hypothetical protein